jgi:hypothetical protein
MMATCVMAIVVCACATNGAAETFVTFGNEEHGACMHALSNIACMAMQHAMQSVSMQHAMQSVSMQHAMQSVSMQHAHS